MSTCKQTRELTPCKSSIAGTTSVLSSVLPNGVSDGSINSLNPFLPRFRLSYMQRLPKTGSHSFPHPKSGVSLSHEINLREARKFFPSPFVLQGNLDPALMETAPAVVQQETNKLLNDLQGDPGHILNLGHGIRPQGKIECVHAMTEAARNFSLPSN